MKSERKAASFWISLITALVYPYICFFLMEYGYPRGDLSDTIGYVLSRTRFFVYAWVVFTLIMLFVWTATRRIWISSAVVAVIFSVAGFANYYKKIYWGCLTEPKDIYNIGSGIKAMEFVETPMPPQMITAFTVAVVFVILTAFIPKMEKVKLLKRIVLSAVVVLVLCIYSVCIFGNDEIIKKTGISDNQKISDRYYSCSYFPVFFSLVKSQMVTMRTPDAYNKQNLDEVGVRIEELSDTKAQKTPDVFVILLELYYDVEQYGFKLTSDISENYNRISKEGYSGRLISPLYGGNTAEAEFEVLTGLATNNNYLSTLAYSNFVYADMPSVVSCLSKKGYTSIAMHSYTTAFFNRVQAYDYLGFNSQHFVDEYTYTETAGHYVSDSSSVKELIRVYEDSIGKSKSPVFINLVTMQNHIPYDEALYYALDAQNVEMVEAVSDKIVGNNYQTYSSICTLMSLTDNSIGELVDYCKNSERDIILVFYGDHQTSISDTFNEVSGFFDGKSEEQQYIDTHTTRYLVWSNFQTVSNGSFGTLALNQLLPYSLKAYNSERPSYFDLLHEDSKSGEVSGVSGNLMIMSDGTVKSLDYSNKEVDEYYAIEYDIISRKLYLENYYS